MPDGFRDDAELLGGFAVRLGCDPLQLASPAALLGSRAGSFRRLALLLGFVDALIPIIHGDHTTRLCVLEAHLVKPAEHDAIEKMITRFC